MPIVVVVICWLVCVVNGVFRGLCLVVMLCFVCASLVFVYAVACDCAVLVVDRRRCLLVVLFVALDDARVVFSVC